MRLIPHKALQHVLCKALNLTLARGYGKVLKLEFDPKTRSLKASVLLEGESEPIDLEIGKFEMIVRDGTGQILLSEIKTSRPWMTTLCSRLLENRPIKVDPAVCSCLSLIL